MENKPKITWDPKTMREVLEEYASWPYAPTDQIIETYERKRAEGGDRACQAKIWHGPGHQSSTFCQQSGPHEDDEHYANIPGEWGVEWEGMKGFHR